MPNQGGPPIDPGAVFNVYNVVVKDSPLLYTPSGNPIIWEFTSQTTTGVTSYNNNLVYFDIKVYHEGLLISSLKAYSTPDNPSGAYCNLSKILDSYVSSEFKPFNTGFADYMTKPVFGYNLVVTAMSLNSSGIITSGNVYTSPICYVFDAKFDRVSFKYYKAYNHLIFTGNPNMIKFLTIKPDKTIVNNYSEEGLCFLFGDYSGGVQINYRFFDNDGALLYDISPALAALPSLPYANSLYRVNVSPSYLDMNFVSLDFNLVGYYTVCLTDSAGMPISETRTFLYRDLPCHLIPVNFYWWNKFGGMDTYQFFVSETNQSVTKSSIMLNPLRRDSDTKLRDYNNKIFNVVEQILDYSTEKTIKVNTQDLSDSQSKWLSSLLVSKNIWMKIDDDLIIPVSLKDGDYSIVSKRGLQNLNTKEFTFRLSDGFDSDYRIL